MATVVRSAVSADSRVQSAVGAGDLAGEWEAVVAVGFRQGTLMLLQQIYSDHEISRLEGFMS